MKFDELLKKVKKNASEASVNDDGHLTVKITVTGENPGNIYMELKERKLLVSEEGEEPFDNEITIKSEDLERLLSRKLNPVIAVTTGKIKVKGNAKNVIRVAKMLM